MKRWERFTEEDIKQFVEESRSYAELARKIGYDNASKNGSAYRAVHQMIDELNLDTSHFTGQGEKIPLEVHHIDGDEINSDLNNLQILCPNCHALTDNYKGKNMNSGLTIVSDEVLVDALNKCPNIRQALMSVGLTGKGGNYIRANELIQKYQIKKFLK